MPESDLAKMLDVSPRTIRRWRRNGTGPRYIKINDRVVRYHEIDVEDWLDNMASIAPSKPATRNSKP